MEYHIPLSYLSTLSVGLRKSKFPCMWFILKIIETLNHLNQIELSIKPNTSGPKLLNLGPGTNNAKMGWGSLIWNWFSLCLWCGEWDTSCPQYVKKFSACKLSGHLITYDKWTLDFQRYILPFHGDHRQKKSTQLAYDRNQAGACAPPSTRRTQKILSLSMPAANLLIFMTASRDRGPMINVTCSSALLSMLRVPRKFHCYVHHLVWFSYCF